MTGSVHMSKCPHGPSSCQVRRLLCRVTALSGSAGLGWLRASAARHGCGTWGVETLAGPAVMCCNMNCPCQCTGVGGGGGGRVAGDAGAGPGPRKPSSPPVPRAAAGGALCHLLASWPPAALVTEDVQHPTCMLQRAGTRAPFKRLAVAALAAALTRQLAYFLELQLDSVSAAGISRPSALMCHIIMQSHKGLMVTTLQCRSGRG